MKKLDTKIIRYYEEQRLSSASLETLLAETAQFRKSPVQMFWARAHVLTWPAVSCAALLLLTFFTHRFYTVTQPFQNNYADNVQSSPNLAAAGSNQTRNLPAATNSTLLASWDPTANIVMQESALNHQSKLRLDFETNDFNSLAEAMEQLDFELKLPQKFAQLTATKVLHTLGGRYCTVVGNLAAHLKFSDTTDPQVLKFLEGKVSSSSSPRDISLFVTPAKPALLKTAGLNKQFDDNTEVFSWHEDGLLYLLVAASSDLNDLNFAQATSVSINH